DFHVTGVQTCALPILGAQWAKFYSEHSISIIYNWLITKKVDFLPVVNWPERGMDVKGNSVPRWHITWGTGYDLSNKVTNYLLNQIGRASCRERVSISV